MQGRQLLKTGGGVQMVAPLDFSRIFQVRSYRVELSHRSPGPHTDPPDCPGYRRYQGDRGPAFFSDFDGPFIQGLGFIIGFLGLIQGG